MNSSARAPAYDLMKLIVAILLLLLFLILLRRGNASSPAPTLTPLPPPAEATFTTSGIDTATPPPESVATTAPTLSHTATPPPPEPSPTATTAAAAAPTLTANSEPTITATPGDPPGGSLCELATSPSRLQVGMNATILRRLNLRSSPGIQNNWLQTNDPGTTVEVLDGPVCMPYFMGVYIWWQIRLPDGTTGWSAEAPINGTYYFMEPGG